MPSPVDTRRVEEAFIEARKCVGARALAFSKLDKERLQGTLGKRDVWEASHSFILPT